MQTRHKPKETACGGRTGFGLFRTCAPPLVTVSACHRPLLLVTALCHQPFFAPSRTPEPPDPPPMSLWRTRGHQDPHMYWPPSTARRKTSLLPASQHGRGARLACHALHACMHLAASVHPQSHPSLRYWAHPVDLRWYLRLCPPAHATVRPATGPSLCRHQSCAGACPADDYSCGGIALALPSRRGLQCTSTSHRSQKNPSEIAVVLHPGHHQCVHVWSYHFRNTKGVTSWEPASGVHASYTANVNDSQVCIIRKRQGN